MCARLIVKTCGWVLQFNGNERKKTHKNITVILKYIYRRIITEVKIVVSFSLHHAEEQHTIATTYNLNKI